ncbi:hypothetical protein KVT40_003905 [Elsinoe batatas]|uniref:C2H2 type master regulator of conidiophore development brlA n=1 Tax=Elsinoe batatas TaxID=2601811 RepID=A0A8K0L2W9_9PEZI|nr:hypothetical protein KVT40_003905 [Elsinoe batatas]
MEVITHQPHVGLFQRRHSAWTHGNLPAHLPLDIPHANLNHIGFPFQNHNLHNNIHCTDNSLLYHTNSNLDGAILDTSSIQKPVSHPPALPSATKRFSLPSSTSIRSTMDTQSEMNAYLQASILSMTRTVVKSEEQSPIMSQHSFHSMEQSPMMPQQSFHSMGQPPLVHQQSFHSMEQSPTIPQQPFQSMAQTPILPQQPYHSMEHSPIMPQQPYLGLDDRYGMAQQVFSSPHSDQSAWSSPPPTGNESDGFFTTGIDVLMRVVQNQQEREMDDDTFRNTRLNNHRDYRAGMQDEPKATKTKNGKEKKHVCNFYRCNMRFTQKTHMEIHKRKHSGEKPFHCKYPPCFATFSQLGNLKTHERRHTGEKPYACPTCNRRFAQRGNVTAHERIHQEPSEKNKFQCKLGACNKYFSQLGNLKSHQNKFHVAEVQRLQHVTAGTIPKSEGDDELIRYMADLYKNCNKGIKGRGKARSIARSSGSPAIKSDTPSSPAAPPENYYQPEVNPYGFGGDYNYYTTA